MAFRDGPLQDLKVPIAWIGAISAVLMGCGALALVLTDSRDKADGGAYGSARGEFAEVIQPVSGVLAAPMRGLGSVGDYIGGYFFAVAENRRLKARIKELEHVRDDVVALKNINSRYEALLQLRTEPPVPMVTARVITDARGPFSNARLADAGGEQGVRVGYPVLSDHGVVGRVVGVAHSVSRVLLLTDADSRTPVLVDRTGARAVLTGDGGAAPRLDYLRGVDPIKQGDVVLTSGDGGLFPRGLPVGVAAKDVRGGWRVRLYSEARDVDYVRILKFEDFGKLAAQAELAAKSMPALPAADAAQLQLATAARSAPPPTAAPKVALAPGATATSTTVQPATAAPATTKPAAATPTETRGANASAARPKAAAAASTRTFDSVTASTRSAAVTATSKPKAATGTSGATASAKPKAKSAAPKRPKAAPARDHMAPVPDDYAPRARRASGGIAPDLEAAMRRDSGR